LTQEERRTAQTEHRALPEYFYTNNNLPIITPENCEEFLEKMISTKTFMCPTLWSWCSGSSRLSSTMAALPFNDAVLFPVDLRYGWDLRRRDHQTLLTKVDQQLRPRMTTIEPRCKYWSHAGTRRDPTLKDELRNNEIPMLQYIAGHVTRLLRQQRHVLIENPRSSAIWTLSPLASLLHHHGLVMHTTKMCHFSPLADGQRFEKATKLLTNIPLRRSAKPCTCRHGHVRLRGYDKEKHLTCTASAALFSHKFCLALSHDITYHLTTTTTSTPTQQRPTTTTNTVTRIDDTNTYPVDAAPGEGAEEPPDDEEEPPPRPLPPDSSHEDRLRNSNLDGVNLKHLTNLLKDIDQHL